LPETNGAAPLLRPSPDALEFNNDDDEAKTNRAVFHFARKFCATSRQWAAIAQRRFCFPMKTAFLCAGTIFA
jgi:hypothetical protein